jgi:hypothetical protein
MIINVIKHCHKKVKQMGEERVHTEAFRAKDNIWYEHTRSYQWSYHLAPGQLLHLVQMDRGSETPRDHKHIQNKEP